MMLKKAFILFVLPFAVLVGCDSNSTNEPTAADIKASDDKRAAAIDNDASLTPEQKASMKQHLGLSGGPSGQPQKR